MKRPIELTGQEAPLQCRPDIALRVEAYAARHGIPLVMAQKCLIAAGLNAEDAAERELKEQREPRD